MGRKLMAVWMALGMVVGIAPLARADGSVATGLQEAGIIADYMTPEQAASPDPAAGQVSQNAAVMNAMAALAAVRDTPTPRTRPTPAGGWFWLQRTPMDGTDR